MAVERPISVLNIYDIYANFIPGVALSLYLFIAIPVELNNINPSPGIALVGLIIGGVILGQILQWTGSHLDDCIGEGAETVFEETLNGLKIDELPTDSQDGLIKRCFQTLTDPLIISYDQELDKTPIVVDFPRNFQRQFQPLFCFPTKRSVFYLITGALINQRMDRTTRFQALHAFFRSMWAASSVSIVLLSLLSIDSMLIHYIDMKVDAYIIFLFLSSIFLLIVFWDRKRKFEKVFVEHVFQDFHLIATKNRQA